MDWTSIAGNVASGGVLGLLGPLLTGGLSLFKGHLEHKRGMELLKLQSEAKTAEAASAIAVAREAGAAAAFTASITAEGAINGEHRWVKDLRGMTRPGLTWAGLLASIACGSFGVQNELTMAVNAYTGMMIAWWFGQRAIDKVAIYWGAGKIEGKVVSK